MNNEEYWSNYDLQAWHFPGGINENKRIDK